MKFYNDVKEREIFYGLGSLKGEILYVYTETNHVVNLPAPSYLALRVTKKNEKRPHSGFISTALWTRTKPEKERVVPNMKQKRFLYLSPFRVDLKHGNANIFSSPPKDKPNVVKLDIATGKCVWLDTNTELTEEELFELWGTNIEETTSVSEPKPKAKEEFRLMYTSGIGISSYPTRDAAIEAAENMIRDASIEAAKDAIKLSSYWKPIGILQISVDAYGDTYSNVVMF